MSSSRSPRTLRAYLVTTILPLAGLPLLVLACLTYVLLGRALDEELARRAGPESAAFAATLETLEQRLLKRVAGFAQQEDFKTLVMSQPSSSLEPYVQNWIDGSHFDTIHVYGRDGRALLTVRRRNRTPPLEEWREWLGSRKPASEAPEHTSTEPFPLLGDRVHDQQLAPDFRAFLRRESGFVARDILGEPAKMHLVFYRTLTDADGSPVGYVETLLALDDARLAMLSDIQGLGLTLVGPQRRVLAASDFRMKPKVEGFSTNSTQLHSPRLDTRIEGKPFAVFFTPLDTNEGVWVGLSLTKEGQTLLQNRILLWVGALALGLAGLVMVLTFRLANWITRPLEDLVGAVEAMRAGEWVHPVEAEVQNEIGFLVKRFNEMALSVQATKRMLEDKLEELAEAHEAITATQGQLVQSAKMSSLGQLVAGVAHELNNPIAFIYSNMAQMRTYLKDIERLAASLDELKARLPAGERAELERSLAEIEWDYLRKDMDDIVRSCTEGSVRVKDIVLGLRNFSRSDQGSVATSDLHVALRNTAKLLQSQLRDRIQIHWALGEDGGAACNLSQMNQVFVNLIANGAQAVEGRGNLWISSEVDTTNDHLVIRIRDDGKGIPPAQLDKIFDPFFTTKKVGEGTGLGLSIVYGILKRHGATIDVKSLVAPAEGHGTEFTLRIPRTVSAKAPGFDGTSKAS